MALNNMGVSSPETKNGFNPGVNNDIGKPTTSLGQKIGFTFLNIITIFSFGIIKKNKLNTMLNKINSSASGIDIQLQKRSDTLIKLLDSVKGSMKFEKETLEKIAELRSSSINDSNRNVMQGKMDSIQRSFNMQVEQYPDLKSVSLVKDMMSSSEMIEREVAAARRLYNSDVNKFNTSIHNFPTNVVACKNNMSSISLFAASEESKKDISLKL